MNISPRLALLLAAILPVALSASPSPHAREHRDYHHPKVVAGETDGWLNDPPEQSSQAPVSVPETASTLLLLGTGLGALVTLRKNFFFLTP